MIKVIEETLTYNLINLFFINQIHFLHLNIKVIHKNLYDNLFLCFIFQN